MMGRAEESVCGKNRVTVKLHRQEVSLHSEVLGLKHCVTKVVGIS